MLCNKHHNNSKINSALYGFKSDLFVTFKLDFQFLKSGE
jgi:hypothetical protein